MGEDTSLEDFLGESDDDVASDDSASATPSDGEPVEETTADTESAEEPESNNDKPTPATTTYAWDGAGAACGSCGEVVERRWQQDGALVCVACKSW